MNVNKWRSALYVEKCSQLQGGLVVKVYKTDLHI